MESYFAQRQNQLKDRYFSIPFFSTPSLSLIHKKFSILQILNHCTIFQLLAMHRAKLEAKLLVGKTKAMTSSSPSPISATFFFSNPSSIPRPRTPPFSVLNTRAMAKDLYFNHDGSTTKKLLVLLILHFTLFFCFLFFSFHRNY